MAKEQGVKPIAQNKKARQNKQYSAYCRKNYAVIHLSSASSSVVSFLSADTSMIRSPDFTSVSP